MKKTTILTITALSLLALLVGIFTPGLIARAQTITNEGGQALEIAPPVIILKVDPGQTIQTKIILRDVSNTKLIVTSQINDFVASGEDGTPKLLIDSNEPNPFSIKNWINPLPELTLESKKTKDLLVTINVPANAAPGGYYGVVRFTATPPELEDTGLSLSASLGALILLRVNGDAKEGLAIEDFKVSRDGISGWLFESTPIQFTERLKNTGNVHEQPVGQITITDMFNKKVATVGINQPPRYILPKSIRKFEQPLDSATLGKKMLFGRYTADLRVSYGSNNQTVTKSITFWIIPWRLILVIIVILIGVIITLYFVVKRYNRYVIKKSQGHRSRHKNHKK